MGESRSPPYNFSVEWLREIFRRAAQGGATERARFDLMFEPPAGAAVVRVGTLSYDGSLWTFEYSSDFRARTDLRPLEGFEDVSKIYQSRGLFPFFAVRIPDENRPDIRRRLAESGITKPTPADMLQLFGRRNVSSPSYELRSSRAA